MPYVPPVEGHLMNELVILSKNPVQKNFTIHGLP